MYNLSLFFFFSSRMFEPTFSLFRHFVYLDLSRNLVPRSSHSLRLSRHFEYISILVGNFGHVILLCARVFSRAAAILKSEKTLGTRLCRHKIDVIETNVKKFLKKFNCFRKYSILQCTYVSKNSNKMAGNSKIKA